MLTGSLDAELNDVPLGTGIENFGQVQKVIFFHLKNSAGAKIKFEPELAMSPTDPALIANWTALLGASDETKPVQSPFISEPVFTAGAKRSYGGGNATMGGVTINIGAEVTTFEGKFLSNSQAAVKAMKTFMVGSGVGYTSVGVVLVNEAGQLGFVSNGLATTALDLYPIPVHSLFIGDLAIGGLEAVDSNMISFELKKDWSDNFYVVTPSDFDALDPAILANT